MIPIQRQIQEADTSLQSKSELQIQSQKRYKRKKRYFKMKESYNFLIIADIQLSYLFADTDQITIDSPLSSTAVV